MGNDQWTKAIRESELKQGAPVAVKVGDNDVFLVRAGHRVLACGAKCTHYGGPLAEGLLVNHSITCPWHHACFDVSTGNMLLPPALDHLPAYPVKLENGDVYIGPSVRAPFPPITGRDDRTFLILGAGAAGNAAAETLRREGFAGRIVMATPESDGPYDRPSLSKEYMAGTAKPEWIPLRGDKFYRQHQIEILFNHRAARVDPARRTVAFVEDREMAFDRLLLATGGIPRNLNVPGTDLDGCFLLRSLADAQRIVAALAGVKQAVIVGTGFIGMEVAASLAVRGLKVHVISREQAPMAHAFGERVARYLQKIHEKNGVRFHFKANAKEIIGDKRAQAITLMDGTRIDADLVVAGLGIEPVVDYLSGTGLVENGAVPVDGRLQTKAEGIFAAGDIAAVPTPPTGERVRIEHWVVAERHGQHAARAMLGHDALYHEPPFFWTKQYDDFLRYVGHAKAFDRIACRGDIDAGQFLVGYYQGGSLKAAAGVRMDREILFVGQMLKEGIAISPEQFENASVNLADFVRPVDVQGAWSLE